MSYVNDPIGDMLTRIRNAIARRHDRVELPASKMLIGIAELLVKEGMVTAMNVVDVKPQKRLVLDLKYVNGQSAIRELKRQSKPGVRKYLGYRELPNVKSGFGVAILSTPKGLMTDKMAKAAKVGGEFICTVW